MAFCETTTSRPGKTGICALHYITESHKKKGVFCVSDIILMNKSAELTMRKFGEDLFERFINYTDVKETTLKGYAVCIRQFFNWMKENNIQQPTREDVKDYKKHLEEQPFTAGTRSQYLRVVKHFFKWTASEGLYPNIADNIKGAKVRQDNTKKEAFNEEDIRIILESIDRSTETGKRNYAMILLSVTGGLRIIEMHRADIQDIATIKGQQVLYIQGKGRDEKDAYIKLIPEVQEALQDYLQSRKHWRKTDPLFAGTGNRAKGGRLEVPSFSRIIKTIFKEAGYDSHKLTAHSLRHTSNTLLFKSGADLYTVQQHARHSDPKTTEIYIHAVDREKDRSEQNIYNQIFRPGQKDIEEAAGEIMQQLSEEDKLKALEFIQKLSSAASVRKAV